MAVRPSTEEAEASHSQSDSSQSGLALDEDTFWIQISRSDGDPERRPKGYAAKYTKLEDDLDTVIIPSLLRWHKSIGEALARAFEWNVNPTSCVLSRLPEGYSFYTMRSTDTNRSTGYVLYGHRSRSFRSPAEFIEHCIWLYSDSTLNTDNCRCIACTKRPQREISEDMKRRGIYPDALKTTAELSSREHRDWTPLPKKTPTFTPDSAHSLERTQPNSPGNWPVDHDGTIPDIQPEECTLQAAASGSPAHTEQVPETWENRLSQTLPKLEPQALQDTDSVPASPSHTQSQSQSHPDRESWFRVGELVHVLLENPIQIASESNLTTPIWPGIILDFVATTGGTEHGLVVEMLSLGGLSKSVITVKQDRVLPYNQDLLSSDAVFQFTLDDGLPQSLVYTESLRRARRMCSTWSITETETEAEAEAKLEDSIRARSVRWGSEQIRTGDFVKIALSRDVLVMAGVKESSTELGLGLFAEVYDIQCRVDDSEAEIMVSVGLFGLEQVDTDTDGPPPLPAPHLPDPPVGFRFVSLHDTGSEVVLPSECIVGRYHSGYLARMLLDENLNLPEEDEAVLMHLGRLWEFQGVKMNVAVRKEFSGV